MNQPINHFSVASEFIDRALQAKEDGDKEEENKMIDIAIQHMQQFQKDLFNG
jgi:hypothetical protein